MRIKPGGTIVGISAVRVRNALRAGDWFYRGDLAELLNLAPEREQVLIEELRRRGFVAPEIGQHGTRFDLTEDGQAFCRSKAMRPLQRRTAERLIEEFLLRARTVRDDPEYVWRVRLAILFGSATSGMPRVNSVDVAIAYETKEADPERFHDRCLRCCNQAIDAGRDLSTVRLWRRWPLEMTRLFLKSRSSGLSLYWATGDIGQRPGAKVIYVHHDDARGQRLLFETDGLLPR